VSRSKTFDRDQTAGKGRRGCSPGLLGFVLPTARCGLGCDDGELSVIGDDEGDVDDVRRRTANPEMVSWCPIASSRRGERRLETRRVEVSFGWCCLLQFAAN
jgi:hypothetical protein